MLRFCDTNSVSCVCPQSQQGHAVYGDQQAVVSQHSKTAASPSSPSIDATATNPNRIKHSQRGIGHSERHSERTADRHSPSRNFQVETNRISGMIFSYPITDIFQCIKHLETAPVHWPAHCVSHCPRPWYIPCIDHATQDQTDRWPRIFSQFQATAHQDTAVSGRG